MLLFAALSLFNPVTAAPTLYAQWSNLFKASASPTLSDGAASLQQPTTPLQLIALGVGKQNYTCASTSATPAAIGAVATLFDATNIVSQSARFNDLAETQMTHLADQSSTDSVNNGLGQQVVGRHFFDSAGVPNFDLSVKGMYLYGKKAGVAPAPSDAFSGRDGQPAVAWLFLNNDGSGRSNGVSSAYRVETVGGNVAASCTGTVPGQVITHDYAALYWFYQ